MEFQLDYAASGRASPDRKDDAPAIPTTEKQTYALVERAKAVVTGLLSSESLFSVGERIPGPCGVLGELDTNAAATMTQQQQHRGAKSKAQARGERAYKAWKEKQAKKGSSTKGATEATPAPMLGCSQSAEYLGVVASMSSQATPPSRQLDAGARADKAVGEKPAVAQKPASCEEGEGWRYKLRLPLWPVTLTLGLQMEQEAPPPLESVCVEGTAATVPPLRSSTAANTETVVAAEHTQPHHVIPHVQVPQLALQSCASTGRGPEPCSSPAQAIPLMMAQSTNPLFDEAEAGGRAEAGGGGGDRQPTSGSSSSSPTQSAAAGHEAQQRQPAEEGSTSPGLPQEQGEEAQEGEAGSARQYNSAHMNAQHAAGEAAGGGEPDASRCDQPSVSNGTAQASKMAVGSTAPPTSASNEPTLGAATSTRGRCSGPSRQEREAFAAEHGNAPHTWKLNERTMRWEPVLGGGGLQPPKGDRKPKDNRRRTSPSWTSKPATITAARTPRGSEPTPRNGDRTPLASNGGHEDDVLRERDMLRQQLQELMAKMAQLEGTGAAQVQDDPAPRSTMQVQRQGKAGDGSAGALESATILTTSGAATPIKAAAAALEAGVAARASPALSDLSASPGSASSSGCSPCHAEGGNGGPAAVPAAAADGERPTRPAKRLSFFDNNLFLRTDNPLMASSDAEGDGDEDEAGRLAVATTPISMAAQMHRFATQGSSMAADSPGQSGAEAVDEDWGYQ